MQFLKKGSNYDKIFRVGSRPEARNLLLGGKLDPSGAGISVNDVKNFDDLFSSFLLLSVSNHSSLPLHVLSSELPQVSWGQTWTAGGKLGQLREQIWTAGSKLGQLGGKPPWLRAWSAVKI
jgi:hypothetical protein